MGQQYDPSNTRLLFSLSVMKSGNNPQIPPPLPLLEFRADAAYVFPNRDKAGFTSDDVPETRFTVSCCKNEAATRFTSILSPRPRKLPRHKCGQRASSLLLSSRGCIRAKLRCSSPPAPSHITAPVQLRCRAAPVIQTYVTQIEPSVVFHII